jgi:hypothetical protein
MQEHLSELAQKYREEMLRLYSGRTSHPTTEPELSTTAQSVVENQSAPASEVLEDSPPPESSENMEASGTPEMPEPMPPSAQEHSGETPAENNYEDPVLPPYISQEPVPIPEAWQRQTADEVRNSAEGKMQITAETGAGAFPVQGARVTVSAQNEGQERLYFLLVTDESGETPVISLPAPPAALSQVPGNTQPYAVYDVKISAPGFFRSVAWNVPVFAGITSNQVFQLIPLPLMLHEDAETIEFPSGRTDS